MPGTVQHGDSHRSVRDPDQMTPADFFLLAYLHRVATGWDHDAADGVVHPPGRDRPGRHVTRPNVICGRPGRLCAVVGERAP